MPPSSKYNVPTEKLTALLEKGCSGDAEAQTELVRLYNPLVASIVGRFFSDSTEREDIVQDVWYRVLKNLHCVHRAQSFVGYIGSTARNVSINALKREKRFEPLDPDNKSSVVVEADRVVLIHQLVERALQALNESQFTILALKIYGGMTFAEIAESLSLPPGTVSTRYYSAIDKLQRAVAQD